MRSFDWISRPLLVGCWIAVQLLVPPLPAWADQVVLDDGRVLEGIVQERGDELVVQTKHGSVRVPKDRVLRVKRALTREQELERRLAQVDPKDPDALSELAEWSRRNRFRGQAKALDARAALAQRVALEEALAEKVAGLEGADPEALRVVSRWCFANGFRAEGADLGTRARAQELRRWIKDAEAAGGVDALLGLALTLRRDQASDDEVRHVLQRIVSLSPNHEAARRLLGHQRFRGAWVPKQQVRAIQAREFAQAQRAKGLVLYVKAWVTPERQLELIEAERAAKQREALRREERDAAKARRRRAQAEASEAERRAEQAAAERDRVIASALRERAEAARLEEERALLSERRALVAAEARALEEKRRAEAKREAVARAALIDGLRAQVRRVKSRLSACEEERRDHASEPTPTDPRAQKRRRRELRALDDEASNLRRELRSLEERLRAALALGD